MNSQSDGAASPLIATGLTSVTLGTRDGRGEGVGGGGGGTSIIPDRRLSGKQRDARPLSDRMMGCLL